MEGRTMEGGITPLHPQRGKGRKEGGMAGTVDAQHVGVEESEEEHHGGKKREEEM